ncbi:unnamed protein product [Mytilus coruscus]|uniref:Ig-like domain-containing protein n=1 Tax=Mytilus coruscus TaxID=42192 RepID=A0A6J8ADP2_MYTCO|nr:unnamed protein product [Mytilus coruscus]
MNTNGVITTIDSATRGIYGSSIDNSSLFIKTITTSEAGNFTCFVTNDMGTARSKTIVVEVIGDLPVVKVEQYQYESIYGENVTLNCNVISDPPIIDVYWERVDTQTILNRGSFGYQGILPNDPSLTIIGSTTFHMGKYRCFATNAIGTSYSESTSLLVKGDKPQVTTTSPVLKANYGDAVTLECIVNAAPKTFDIYWYKKINGQNQFTYINEKFPGISGSSVETPSLTIDYATPANEGSYRCYARNEAGVTESKPVKLVVEADLPEVNVPLEPFSTVAGFDVILKCVIKAVPQAIEVYWQRHTSNDVHTIIKSSTLNIEGSTVGDPSLTIRKASVSMSGEYTCIARNHVGTVRSLPTVLKVEDSSSDSEIVDHSEYIVLN